MASPSKLLILEHERTFLEVPLTGPLEVGRQRLTENEPGPYVLLPATDVRGARVIIAPHHESNCSRLHLVLQPLPSGLVRVTNRSQVPFPLPDEMEALAVNASTDLTVPFRLVLGGRTLAVSSGESSSEFGLTGLDGKTVAPGTVLGTTPTLSPLPALSSTQLDGLVAWLQTTTNVLQSAIGSADFLQRAAEALVQIVGLDSGRVLLLEGDTWTVVATHGASAAESRDWQPSRHVLARIREEKRTFWQSPQQPATSEAASVLARQSAIASPLLNGAGSVIGALYGERRKLGQPSLMRDGKLEAVLVEMVACSIATGLARQEQEKEKLKAHVLFEQFFTPQLARQLRETPSLLDGRVTEVTLLFCDVRGYSRASERLGPAGTVEWMSDVLGELSKHVLHHEGVLVDYIGDELLAMWGAPQYQPDHALRAASAALAMLESLERLNRTWQPTLGGPMSLGMGLNTGPAHVGNIGSAHKFKYGALGNTVNLASRVQGLTKYLRCRLLATAGTRRLLTERFIARRVCRTRVVNIEEPVDLYEVEAAGSERRRLFFQEAEDALDALESLDFARAARAAGSLLLDHPRDGPLQLLLLRAAQQLMHEGSTFDPVWVPPDKGK